MTIDEAKFILWDIINRSAVLFGEDSAKIDEAVEKAINALNQPTGWIKIKTRPLTAEELEELGSEVEFMYDCDMPEDGQEVLVTTSDGQVDLDIFNRDADGACYFETYYGTSDVLAWQPLPGPWEGLG